MIPRRRITVPAMQDPSALAGFAASLRAKIAAARLDLVRLEAEAARTDALPSARDAAEAARLALEADADALAHVRAAIRKAAPLEGRGGR